MSINNLLKNVSAYSAELPDMETVQAALQELPFTEVTESEYSRAGFVPNPATGELVSSFPSGKGFVFTVRIDRKRVPAAAINREADNRIKRIEEMESRKVNRKERKQIKEDAERSLLARAFVTTRLIHGVYHAERNHLLLSNASKPEADRVMSMLIRCLGKVRTKTIHVNGMKLGVTTRLKSWLEEDDSAFDGFEVGGECTLVRKTDTVEKVTFAIEDLRSELIDIREALDSGFFCESIGLLANSGLPFTLTSELQIKKVQHEPMEFEEDDPAYAFRAEAEARTITVSAILSALCAMFGYSEELTEADEPQTETEQDETE